MSAQVSPQSQNHISHLVAMGAVVTLSTCKHNPLSTRRCSNQYTPARVEWHSKYTILHDDFFIHSHKKANYICSFTRKINCKQKQYLKVFLSLGCKSGRRLLMSLFTTRNEHAAQPFKQLRRRGEDTGRKDTRRRRRRRRFVPRKKQLDHHAVKDKM